MATPQRSQGGAGVGVDSSGGPVVDPTENVKALSEAANKRQDDLRAKDREFSDLQHKHAAIIAKLRAKHEAAIGLLREEYQEKIAKAEAGRLDSIRQVDREEVAKTAVSANTAITTLAKQTTDLQQTLAKQVTDTAAAAETRSSGQYNDTNKRLSALELSSSAGSGKSLGFDKSWAVVLAVIGLLFLYLNYQSRTAPVTAPAPVIYQLAPVAPLPSTGAAR